MAKTRAGVQGEPAVSRAGDGREAARRRLAPDGMHV